jgi:hypothetical protein
VPHPYCYSIADIIEFIQSGHGVPSGRVRPDADLCRDLGIEGDDFAGLMGKFCVEFGVEMSAYRWYFHHGDEVGGNPFSLIFRPPYRSVEHIPVTPALLLASANSGKWVVQYPPHTLPKLRLEGIAFALFLFLSLVWAIWLR